MDEPTSSLTVAETDRLLEVIADLKADGVSVIFISHRLDEVEQCADRVVVLRDGRVVGELARERDRPRRDDPADDRPRPEVALHPAGARAAATRCSSCDGLRTAAYPDRAGRPRVRTRRDPRPRRPGRRRPHRARPRRVRHRPRRSAARFASTARQLAPSARRATPSTRGIFLVPGGPQALRACARLLDRARTSRLPNLRRSTPGYCSSTARRERSACRAQRAALDIKTPRCRRRASARCRAATSRRWCWPNGCR